ncbi:MAG: mechanosensitive ion channel [Planctomycetaceae bacterium]|nr:mechanosensitive ion channel [Planctomycetaceae bacterium]
MSEWMSEVLPFSGTVTVFGFRLLLAAATGLLLHCGALIVLRRFARRRQQPIDAALLQRLRGPLLVLLPLLCVQVVLASGESAAELQLPRHICSLGIIAGTVYLLLNLLSVISRHLKTMHAVDVEDNYHARRMHTQVTVLRRCATLLIVVVGVSVALMTFPRIRQLGASLLASAGVVGLVAGLAARPVLENLIAGLQIALTRPIQLDDAVVIDGEWGWIEEIASTYVVLRIWDQRRLIVPLSKIINEPLQNWTRRTAQILGTVFLHLDYSVPVQAVREELERAVRLTDRWDGRVCVLQVTDFTERTVELRALVSAASSPAAWDLRVFVRERLLEFLQREHPGALPRARLEVVDPEGGHPAVRSDEVQPPLRRSA